MRNILTILLIVLFCAIATAQDNTAPVRVTLKTGAMIDGVVKFENDEVLLIITERGERYQLQKSAIADVGTPKEEAVVVEDKASGNPFGVMINVGAGFCSTSNQHRADITADLIMGHRLLLKGAMFLGAGIGYDGALNKKEKWHFLPLYAHVRYNFLPDKKNAPVVSLSAGYAFSLTGDVRGGALGDVALMYRHKIGGRSAVNIGLYFRVHGYMATESTEIDGIIYTGKQNGAMYSFGGRLSIEM